MDEVRRFADLVLDKDALHTPVGTMLLPDITRAEFNREVVSDGQGPSTQEVSAPAVAGGVIIGGALLGPAGAVGGGLLGSTVKEDVPGEAKWRTKSVTLTFETNELAYSMDISRDREAEANRFAQAVRKAAKRFK